MSEALDDAPSYSLPRAAGAAGIALALTLYAALAATATVIYPPIGAAFLAPPAIAILAVAPAAKASPRR
ncbi:MAG: hypothetical protein ACOZAA_03435, partial [Pseudomonadota bacterium]